jgi:hypothetical protein
VKPKRTTQGLYMIMILVAVVLGVGTWFATIVRSANVDRSQQSQITDISTEAATGSPTDRTTPGSTSQPNRFAVPLQPAMPAVTDAPQPTAAAPAPPNVVQPHSSAPHQPAPKPDGKTKKGSNQAESKDKSGGKDHAEDKDRSGNTDQAEDEFDSKTEDTDELEEQIQKEIEEQFRQYGR